ncbi:hypothetical protein ACFFJB_05935 [Camelimonas abortus]|uniref:Uncharacterized protein n=1 Tax=Camelimonas abortus TaxID=1017184 RepID=A0ABV7LDJ7_9HYPH
MPVSTAPGAAAPPGSARPSGARGAVIIEIADLAAGILAADGAGYRFHAAGPRFAALDGRIFRSAGEAERAARHVLTARKRVSGVAAPEREARR